jgi:hypothetical protein
MNKHGIEKDRTKWLSLAILFEAPNQVVEAVVRCLHKMITILSEV